MSASEVAKHSEETFRIIKGLNKLLNEARSRSEKDVILAQIKLAKDKWWERVRPVLAK